MIPSDCLIMALPIAPPAYYIRPPVRPLHSLSRTRCAGLCNALNGSLGATDPLRYSSSPPVATGGEDHRPGCTVSIGRLGPFESSESSESSESGARPCWVCTSVPRTGLRRVGVVLGPFVHVHPSIRVGPSIYPSQVHPSIRVRYIHLSESGPSIHPSLVHLSESGLFRGRRASWVRPLWAHDVEYTHKLGLLTISKSDVEYPAVV